MPGSEVAQLRRQIDQEIAAAKLAMNGYAVVARHDIISHHFEALGACLEQLQAQVGEQAAAQIVVEALEDQL